MTDKGVAKPDNLVVNLLLNILVPTLILVKFSGEGQLGPRLGILVALAFPVGYGVWDYWRAGRVNFFAALGVVNVVLTGGMSLLAVDPRYIAVKEAAVPGVLAVAILGSLKTPFPLVRVFFYNDMVLATGRIDAALRRHGAVAEFERALVRTSWMLAGSFALSAALNYFLARRVLVSEPGTEAFNVELGTLTALSLPVIAVPAMLVTMGALVYLFRAIMRLSGLGGEDILRGG